MAGVQGHNEYRESGNDMMGTPAWQQTLEQLEERKAQVERLEQELADLVAERDYLRRQDGNLFKRMVLNRLIASKEEQLKELSR